MDDWSGWTVNPTTDEDTWKGWSVQKGPGAATPSGPSPPAAAPPVAAGGPQKGIGLWDATKTVLGNDVQGLVNQFKLPGDVYSGKKDINDPSVQNEAIGLGTNIALGMKPMDVDAAAAPKVTPEEITQKPNVVNAVEPKKPSEEITPEATPSTPDWKGWEVQPGQNKYSIAPMEEVNKTTLGYGKDSNPYGQLYQINKDGTPHGSADISFYNFGKEANINDIDVPGGSQTLGASTMRDLLRQFRQQHPNVEKLTGNRISGARHGGEQVTSGVDVEVPLPEWKGWEVEPQPQSVGAAATPDSAALPEQPSKPFIKDQEDAFHRLRQSATADKLELSQYAKNVPEEMQDKALQEKFYRAKEDPALQAQFTPREKELYDTYQKPLDKEETDLANEIKDAGFGDDEGYVHRIVKGRAPQFDRLAGEAAADNPIGGYRSLPRTTSSLQNRVYHALEDAKGNRTVVALKDGRLTAVAKGKPGTPLDAKLASKDFDEIQPGAKVNVAGKDFTLKQAKTDEIEKATGTEYYKNAMANTIDNIARLRVTARAIDQVRKLKDTPEWQQYTFPRRALEKGWNGPKPPDGYITPKMPMFQDTLMDPKLAHVIDDFYGRGNRGPLFETLAKINNFAYRSLFWSPIPHAANVTADYIITRGWDWMTPQGLRSLVIDGPEAVRQVIGRGPKYQQMLRDGSGMTSGSLQNSAFYERIAKALGEDIVKNPERWNPIIRKLGLSKPADMVKMLYDASSRVMFAYGDVLMMQRVMELERKGMSPRAAIADAEKHMANYRMPSQVLRSRKIQQGLSDPLVTAFSRYHYGTFNSIANMATDLVKGTGKEKFDALGNVFALGALAVFVIPAINHALQALTGNPNAKARYPGTASIPASLIDMYNGDKEFPQFVQNTITLAPLLETGLQTYQNRDYFGRNIVEPDDVRKGNIKAAAGQEAEHLAGSLVQPYNLIQQAAGGKKTLGQTVRDSALGITEQDPRSKAVGRKIEANEAKARKKRPRGLIEKLTQ